MTQWASCVAEGSEQCHDPHERPRYLARRQKLEIIVKLTAAEFGCSSRDILSESRIRALAQARAMIAWVARKTTSMSYQDIGQLLQRDHSTIIDSIQAHERRMAKDPTMHAAAHRVLKLVVEGGGA